jgi:hypothetical protein
MSYKARALWDKGMIEAGVGTGRLRCQLMIPVVGVMLAVLLLPEVAGHLLCLWCLREAGCILGEQAVTTGALKNGHLQCLRYVVEPGCHTGGLRGADECGHTDAPNASTVLPNPRWVLRRTLSVQKLLYALLASPPM